MTYDEKLASIQAIALLDEPKSAKVASMFVIINSKSSEDFLEALVMAEEWSDTKLNGCVRTAMERYGMGNRN